MIRLLFALLILSIFWSCNNNDRKIKQTPEVEYLNLKEKINSGWNTWDNRSILTQVYLPEGLAVSVSLKDTESGKNLKFAFTGNRVPGSEKVETISHTPDGSYTDHLLHWKSFDIRTQTLTRDDNLYFRIINKNFPVSVNDSILVSQDFIYQKSGETQVRENIIESEISGRMFRTSVLGSSTLSAGQNSLRIPFEDTLYIYCGETTEPENIDQWIAEEENKWIEKLNNYGDYRESYNAIQNAVNWTVVYDPDNSRAVIPVSRPWSYGWGEGEPGGWVQFCWDNFFVAYMQAMESKELAFNEAIQMCNYIDELGFVPNYAGPGGLRSFDRSQPPVGSMMVKEIYKIHPEKWFLEKTFDQLLKWNRWWNENRHQEGYLSWGSNPYQDGTGDAREEKQHNHKAALYESGLDNSPMYDGVPFDKSINMLKIADVGLTSLYIGDCDALADMARVLERSKEAKELEERADYFRENLKKLWDEDFGLFLNKRTDTDEFSYRLSPTLFYPLIAKAATQEQAQRMMKEHFYNPEEFWGEWIMPSISRNDTAYTAQDYWRGSIWAPMNFLVYLGMRNYDLSEARKDLSEKSKDLLMKEWLNRAYIRENYHAERGGAPDERSEHFYHWGALLGMINMIEEGFVPPTETSLHK